MAKKKSTAKKRKKNTPKKPLPNRGIFKGNTKKKKPGIARKRAAVALAHYAITAPKGHVQGYSVGSTAHSYDASGQSAYSSVVVMHYQAEDANGSVPVTIPLMAPTPNPGAGGPIRVPVNSGNWSIPHTATYPLYVISSNRIYQHLFVVWHLTGNTVQSIETSCFTPDL